MNSFKKAKLNIAKVSDFCKTINQLLFKEWDVLSLSNCAPEDEYLSYAIHLESLESKEEMESYLNSVAETMMHPSTIAPDYKKRAVEVADKIYSNKK